MSQPASVIPLSPVSRKAPERPLNSLPEIKDDSSLFYRFLPAHLAEWATQNSGLLYVACSQFFFALMNLTVKYFLSITQISVLTLIAVRMVITSLGCISALYLMGDPNYLLGPPDIRYFLAARGIVGFLGLFGNYQSFKGLSVSDSTAIQFLAPSVTAFLGYLFLKETLSRRELMAGVFCLGGVLLVSRPPFLFGARDGTVVPPDDSGTVYIPGEGEDPDLPTPERMRAVAWAFLTVFSASGAYVLIRYIGDKAHALHSMSYFSYLCSIVCCSALVILPGPIAWPDTWYGFFLILTVGVFGFCAQTFLTLGLQREKAGRAGLAMYLSIERKKSPEATDDVESQPISRTPSPIPPPSSGRPTIRGEHYSYDSEPLVNDDELHDGDEISPLKGSAANGKPLNGMLSVSRHGIGRRRSSGRSSISGFTSDPGSE